jgi:Mn-dependent DtxR family transcriptional regulator
MLAVKEKRLTLTEERVLEAYKYYLRLSNGETPSFVLIGARAGVPSRMVPDFLRKLERGGYIEHVTHRSNSSRK